LQSAELERDVEILPAGHDTEIGEKGVNLRCFREHSGNIEGTLRDI
jgi:hypothetical protein